MVHIHNTCTYTPHVYSQAHQTYHLPKAIFDALAPILEALTIGIFTTSIPAALWAVVHFL